LIDTVKGDFISDIVAMLYLFTVCLLPISVYLFLVAMLRWERVWRPVIPSVLQREWNGEIQRGK